MGKWTKFKGKLQRFEHEEEYQAKVDRVKAGFAEFELAELAELFKENKYEKAKRASALAETNTTLEALSQMLLGRFEAAGVDSVRLSSGGTLSETPVPYPKLTDEETFLRWLKKKHPDERLKFPWPSLERMVKHHLEEGEALPPGVEVFLKNTVRLYGGGSGSGEED